jgi:pimeloyl-ACP methyl ester carboxylesterase
MFKTLMLAVAVFGCHFSAQAAKVVERPLMLDVKSHLVKDCRIRVFITQPENTSEISNDVLFFTGFGDRADNHAPLFARLAEHGSRVISFDYPSHGETECGNLNFKSFTSLFSYTEQIERQTREQVTRPLYVTGWSTGGLLALRLAQAKRLNERTWAGLVLLAPGVSVHKLVGEFGVVTEATLLSNPNPPHRGPIKPVSPLLTPVFAKFLLDNSGLSQIKNIPLGLPSLIILAGDGDRYVKTDVIRKWFLEQKNLSSKVAGFQCPQSKHELDNEIEPIGSEVRQLFASFIANPQVLPAASVNCLRITEQ